MDKCQKCKNISVKDQDAFGLSLLNRVIDKHVLIPICQKCGDILYSKKTYDTILSVIKELEAKETYHRIGGTFPRLLLREGCYYECCDTTPFYNGIYIIRCGILHKLNGFELKRFEIPYYNDKILFKRINPLKSSGIFF